MKLHIYLTLAALLVLATLKSQNDFQTCLTPPTQQLHATALSPPDPSLDYCATVKIEVDWPAVQMLGGLIAAQNRIEPILSDVAAIYNASGLEYYGIPIGMEFDVHYWTGPSPYTGPSSGNYLSSYRTNHLPHNSMVTQLLGAGSSGGIAYVGAQCNDNFGVSFSNLINQFAAYPSYSWNVMVIAHELGHNFGSSHTHACVWNGNGTAIDGCAGGTEGGCPNPGSPSSGGTVMSYCHFTTGIDFTQGFGPQPTAVILNGIASAGCSTCTDDPPPPPGNECDGNELLVQVSLDYWPGQSYWELKDGDEVIATAGPWEQSQMNMIIEDTLCVPDGCYDFVMYDLEGNGLGPLGCSEGLYVVQNGITEVASGQVFTYEDITAFCLGETDEGGCDDIVFDEILSMSGHQDQGTATVGANGYLSIEGNAWKGIALEYEVTPNTVLEFDVRIEREGEIHGIGFVPERTAIYPLNTIRVAGTQAWGNGAYDDDFVAANFRHYEIPIGQVYQASDLLGSYPYLAFVNDMDVGTRDPAATWKGVVLCEADPQDVPRMAMPRFELFEAEPYLYPNPARDTINLPKFTSYYLYSAAGKMLFDGRGKSVNISKLPPGLYFIWWEGQAEEFVKL